MVVCGHLGYPTLTNRRLTSEGFLEPQIKDELSALVNGDG